MQISILDSSIIVGYILALLGIGVWQSRQPCETTEYLLAGRRLTLPIFIATLVATIYGGIFGIAEFASRYGLAVWLTQGIFWYFIYILFALVLAVRIQKMRFFTIADILENRYNIQVAKLGGIFTYLMINPAPYFFSLGMITSLLTGLPLVWTIIISTIIMILYTIFSGFRGVIYTDVLQFILMYVSFGILFIATLAYFGGWSFLDEYLNRFSGFDKHLNITGNMSLGQLLAWAGLACWALVDPNFYQRCYAAGTPQTARKGILISILFWATFDIFSCMTALYGIAAHNAKIITITSNSLIHITLADFLLYPGIKGLFFAGVLAIIMSTADSNLFAAAVNLSQDYYWRVRNRNATSKQMIRATQISIIITGVFAAGLAIAMPSVVDLWYSLGTIGLAGLLLPVLASFTKRTWPVACAIMSMSLGSATALVWLVLGIINKNNEGFQYPLNCQPLYIGLLAAILGWSIGFFFKKNDSK